MPNQTATLSRAAVPARAALGGVALSARGVWKAFGSTPVLTDVDLHVPAGAVVALLGPSGCGKTTLLRALAGLERPDAGVIRVGDRVLSSPDVFVPAERRRIGMVFQDWALFPHLSVAGNVGFGLSRAERREGRVDAALELVELAGLADRTPATLSGGQQQRVALARALATRPAALLLDEPFSNLDAGLRASIRADVVRLLRELEVTAVVVTHDQEEAFLVGDQVAVMFDGCVQQQATPAAIYEAPASRAVAAFVGDANLLPATADAGTAATAIGLVPLRSNAARGAVEVMLRPEHIEVSPGTEHVVEAVEYYGHDALVLVRTPVGTVRARVLSAPSVRPGDGVDVRYAGAPAVSWARSSA